MKCGIVSCDQKDNRYLWRCHGACNRQFHAACVGAQRHHEEVLRTFVLPLCHDCQEKFTSELNLKKLEVSLTHISENIGKTLEANHKLLTNFKTLSATHDGALETIEEMLHEIKNNISNAASCAKSNTAEIKSSMSSLLDTPPSDSFKAIAKAAATAAVAAITTTTKEHIEEMAKATAAVSAMTTTATSHAINELPQLITTLKNDFADSQALLACQVKSNMENIVKTMSSKPVAHENLAEELQNAEQSNSGWRFLGTIKKWKPDWSAYDAKLKHRAVQQKAMDKAAKQRKKRRRRSNNNKLDNNDDNCLSNENFYYNYSHNNINHTNFDRSQQLEVSNNIIKNNSIGNKNSFDKNSSNTTEIGKSDSTTPVYKSLPLDKDLLAAARSHFSGNSNADATCKIIKFQKGETINPYRKERVVEPNHSPPSTESSAICANTTSTDNQADSLFELDPMRPPIVRLTEQSAEGDGRFLKARLRDQKIMNVVRLYLAFMKDQQPSVCVEGMTPTSIKILLASEGLPTNPEQLQRIFIEVHQEYGQNPADAIADLQTYRNFLSSQRIQRLQQLRESTNKFYTNFQRH